MSDRTDEILLALEWENRAQHARVRQMFLEAGRLDILKEYDARMRDIELGVYGARSVWHSISTAQKRALLWMKEHGACIPVSHQQRRTIACLLRRKLVEIDTGDKAILTEHGRFVLNHGRDAPR